MVRFFSCSKSWKGVEREGQGVGKPCSLVIKSVAVKQTLKYLLQWGGPMLVGLS